ncbi:hypothetical protein BC629DRAFT_7221 [Irpex lacteus]|nr:hypothetical protein BC629DRAFT_7221 [Irpex lacteus]
MSSHPCLSLKLQYSLHSFIYLCVCTIPQGHYRTFFVILCTNSSYSIYVYSQSLLPITPTWSYRIYSSKRDSPYPCCDTLDPPCLVSESKHSTSSDAIIVKLAKSNPLFSSHCPRGLARTCLSRSSIQKYFLKDLLVLVSTELFQSCLCQFERVQNLLVAVRR